MVGQATLLDWVGGVFGSDNTADKVRADLKTYKNNVARLQNAPKKGDAKIQTNIPERLWRKNMIKTQLQITICTRQKQIIKKHSVQKMISDTE